MRDHAVHLHFTPSGALHDQFCRCRECKPGTVRAREDAEAVRRVKVGAAGLALVTIGVVCLRASGVA